MRRDLDEHVRLGQIKRRVGHLTHEDGVHLGVKLEVLQDLDTLALPKDMRLVRDIEQIHTPCAVTILQI